MHGSHRAGPREPSQTDQQAAAMMAGRDAGREAVHYLVRINQTVLTLIEELTPDIADHAAA
jgi:hypothetical protein